MPTPGAEFVLLSLLLFGCAFGTSLLLRALARWGTGRRESPLFLAPAAGGALVLLLLLALEFTGVRTAFSRALSGALYPSVLGPMESRITALVAIGGGFVAAEVVTVNARGYLSSSLSRLQAGVRSNTLRWVPDAVVFALIGLIAASVLVLVATIESRYAYAVQPLVTIAAEYPLPGEPMGVAVLTAREGYLSFGDGTIRHYVIPADHAQELALQTVAQVDAPRGMAILDGVLYVTDSGPSVCSGSMRACEALPVLLETEERALAASSGRIVAYDIREDGSLAGERNVIQGLPVATFRHALNMVTAGPDGYLYVSLGGFDHNFGSEPALADSVSREDTHLLGSVLRVSIDGADIEVYAHGLRNVYDIIFNHNGELFGIDNDGPTVRGGRLEEVMHLRQGDDFGYPELGSVDPGRKSLAFWYADQITAASGLEWAERVGLGPGLVIGSFGRLDYIALSEDESGYYVHGPESLRLLAGVEGFLTGLQATPDGRLIGTLYGSVVSDKDYLVVYDVARETAGAPSTEVEVIMHDNYFEPDIVVVPAGVRVSFTYENAGASVHNLVIPLRERQGRDFRTSATVASGEHGEFDALFGQPGEYEFLCTLHPGMVGTIIAR